MKVEFVNVTIHDLKQILRYTVREELERIEQQKPKTIKLYTSKEVMNALSISESTFRRWVKEGKLPAVKINGRIRVNQEHLESLQEEVKSLKYKRS